MKIIMKITNQDKLLVTQFLELHIDREEFEILYTKLLNLVELINFEKKYNFNNLKLEIEDDNDNFYKQVKINLKDNIVCMELCEKIDNNYFISKKLTYYNDNYIEFTKILVKSEYSKSDKFTELTVKKQKYNGKGVSIKYFTELESINYIEDIPIYSVYDYNMKKCTYLKCLSKNK